MSTTVQTLVSLQVYQQSRANLFGSIESIRWYARQHRDDLIKAGALLTVAGRVKVDPAQFDSCVLAFGKQAAQRVSP
jgi:hypothetical protein